MKKTSVLFFALFVLLPVAGWTGEYVLVKGKGVEVCEEYGKNLNSFPPDTQPPICEAKINQKFADFKKPKWRKWLKDETWRRRHLIRDMEWRIAVMVNLQEYFGDDGAFYSKLKSDLDNDQYPLSLSEAVFKWRDGAQTTYVKRESTCDAVTDYDEPMGRIFFVLNKTADKTVSVESMGTTSSQYPFRRPDIVFYKDEPILQIWASGELEIIGITGIADCKYRYTKSEHKGGSK